MTRRHISLVIVLLFLVTPLFAKSHVPKKNTRKAIKEYVEEAAELVSKKGPDCAALNGPDYKGGDYYVFVSGPDGKTLCHPDPKIVGKAMTEIVDANGKKVGVELDAAAKKKGGGWVDYVWARPGTTKPVAKSTYVTTTKGPDGKMYMVGAGGYEVK